MSGRTTPIVLTESVNTSLDRSYDYDAESAKYADKMVFKDSDYDEDES